MKAFFIKLLINALAAWILAYVIKGIYFTSAMDAFWFAFVMAFLNGTVKPVLQFFTLPITVFSLGLFLLVINGLMVEIADYAIEGMQTEGFINVLVFSAAYSVLSLILNTLFKSPATKSDSD